MLMLETDPGEVPGVVPLERLAHRSRLLSEADAFSAYCAVQRFGRRTFLGMIDAAPPERAFRLRAILRLSDRHDGMLGQSDTV